jgi:hypothetical protein
MAHSCASGRVSSSPGLRPWRLGSTICAAALLGLAGAAGRTQAPPPSGFPGVAPEGPPARILDFGADPTEVAAGDPVTLRWEAINAYAIELDPGQGAVATRGSRVVHPNATTTYTLSVTGPRGTSTEAVTVNVTGGGASAASAAPAGERQSIPRLGDGRPDLSGVYLGGRGIAMVGEVMRKPGAEQFRVQQNDNDLGQGALCLPPGVPNATMMPYPLQIVQREDMLVILYEAYNLFRIIPIGVEQPEDLDPTWMGHSVASWDGDTLVVDVTGFNDRTQIAGNRHTEAMHVVERYRRTSYDTIEYEASVEDPNVFAEPVRYAGDLILHPEWEIGEYVCTENNKDYSELFSN